MYWKYLVCTENIYDRHATKYSCVSNFLYPFLLTDNFSPDDFWIGLNDLDQDGDFVFESSGSSQSDVTSWPWYHGVPHYGGDCVAIMHFGSTYMYEWLDLPCYFHHLAAVFEIQQ